MRYVYLFEGTKLEKMLNETRNTKIEGQETSESESVNERVWDGKDKLNRAQFTLCIIKAAILKYGKREYPKVTHQINIFLACTLFCRFFRPLLL